MQKQITVNNQASWHWLKDDKGNWQKWRTLAARETVIIVIDLVGTPFDFIDAVKSRRLLTTTAATTAEGQKVEWLADLQTFAVKEFGK